MSDRIKVRARKTLFHGGTRVYEGEVFEVTPAQLAHTKARYKDRKIDPPYELVSQPKAAAEPAKPADPDADLA
jgi:hypothetical protein